MNSLASSTFLLSADNVQPDLVLTEGFPHLATPIAQGNLWPGGGLAMLIKHAVPARWKQLLVFNVAADQNQCDSWFCYLNRDLDFLAPKRIAGGHPPDNGDFVR